MSNRRKAITWTILAAFTGLTYLAGSQLAGGDSYGMGPGMMRPGMMGPGMMGPPRRDVEPSPASVNPARARALLSYIHEQNAVCLQCHAISEAGFGPPFALIAEHYAGQDDAEQLLASHIAHGFGRMPPGLASDAQAEQLARLILALPETASPNQAEQERR
jgi:cytochrome c551/c552